MAAPGQFPAFLAPAPGKKNPLEKFFKKISLPPLRARAKSATLRDVLFREGLYTRVSAWANSEENHGKANKTAAPRNVKEGRKPYRDIQRTQGELAADDHWDDRSPPASGANERKTEMKKLMIVAAAALCATVGFGDIESSNMVGYTTKAAGANLNWYAPQFFACGYNTTDINSINLDDDGAESVGWGDTMQIVGPLGNASASYLYYDKSMDPSEKATGYYWGDDAGNAVSVSFDAGDGIAIDNASELTFSINNAGEVPVTDVTFPARANLNFTGNPFPQSINLNAITLDDGGAETVGWGDTMQIVGPLGNASASYLYYDKSMDPDEKATGYYWGDDAGYPVDVTLNPGDGFAIDNASELTFDVKIACPYTK